MSRDQAPTPSSPAEPRLERVFASLDRAQEALDELESKCCEPGRSPRMAAIGHTLAEARRAVTRIGADTGAHAAATALFEDAGAQLGRLQVACCAPNRLPLYAAMLESLTTAQRSLNGALGIGH